VAVWPPDAVLRRLEALARPPTPGLRWTTSDQWHVTLRFLGAAPPVPAGDRLDAAPGLLGRGGGPVTARLGPASAWFPRRRVLQIPVAGLDALAAAVVAATADTGDPDPGVPWRGHLTLARMRGGAPGPSELAGTRVEASWPVEEITLVASELDPAGARYRIVRRVPLHR